MIPADHSAADLKQLQDMARSIQQASANDRIALQTQLAAMQPQSARSNYDGLPSKKHKGGKSKGGQGGKGSGSKGGNGKGSNGGKGRWTKDWNNKW